MVESGQGLRAHRHEVGQAGGGGEVTVAKGQLAGVAVAADEREAVPEVVTARGVVRAASIMAHLMDQFAAPPRVSSSPGPCRCHGGVAACRA